MSRPAPPPEAAVPGDDLLERLAAGAAVADRVAVVAAHPDDETLGLGGRLDRFQALRLIHLTDGAPADGVDARRAGFAGAAAYAAARRCELDAALVAAGAQAERRAYDFADQAAALRLADLARCLAVDLGDRDAVFTHPYEGGHPDHDAAAFAVQAAVRVLERGGRAAPARFEFASYHRRGDSFVAGLFHPDPARPEVCVRLETADRRRKAEALERYRSQARVVALFPDAVERWRPAPDYDFSRPPPPEVCLYDDFGWPLTSRRWRELAQAALVELELAP